MANAVVKEDIREQSASESSAAQSVSMAGSVFGRTSARVRKDLPEPDVTRVSKSINIRSRRQHHFSKFFLIGVKHFKKFEVLRNIIFDVDFFAFAINLSTSFLCQQIRCHECATNVLVFFSIFQLFVIHLAKMADPAWPLSNAPVRPEFLATFANLVSCD